MATTRRRSFSLIGAFLLVAGVGTTAAYFSDTASITQGFVALFPGDPEPPPVPEACQGRKFKETIVGTSGDDTLRSTTKKGPVLIFGLGGDDTIVGTKGKDCLVGGDGDDFLLGEAGDDVLLGDDGHDILAGGKGKDRLYGGLGDDLLVDADLRWADDHDRHDRGGRDDPKGDHRADGSKDLLDGGDDRDHCIGDRRDTYRRCEVKGRERPSKDDLPDRPDRRLDPLVPPDPTDEPYHVAPIGPQDDAGRGTSPDPSAPPTDPPTPEPDATPDPTTDPTPDPTPDATVDPTPDPTPEPTPEPTEEPTREPTPDPTPDPTPEPTPDPTPDPTPTP